MTLLAGNLLTENAQSIETDASGWSTTAGPAGAPTQSGAHFRDGSHSLEITSTGSGDIQVSTASSITVTAGAAYRIYFSVWCALGRSILMEVDWYDGTGHLISSSLYPQPDAVIPTSTWTQYVTDMNAPAGAVTARMVLRPQAGASGDQFWFDLMYFGPTALTITATPNRANAYNAINVTGLSDWDTVAVQRTDPDGTQTIIRSADYIATSGDTWAGFDVEAPLGAPVTYTVIAQIHNWDGSITTGTASTGYVTIPVNTGVGWLKDLSQTALSTMVTIQAVSDIKRAGRSTAYPVVGRSNPIVVSDVLSGRTGTVTLMTTSDTAASQILQLVANGDTLFLQATPADGFHDLYFVAGDVTERRPASDSGDGTRLWDIDFTEVDSPSGDLTSLPGNSWLLVTSFGTWQAVMSHRTSWLGVLNTSYGSGIGGI